MSDNRTAEQVLRKHIELASIKRGDGPVSDEEWEDGRKDGALQIAIDATEEYASQQTASLREERDKLQKFKEYVHDRLDKMGIPVDPDSPHKEAGCRIGGRLDVVVAMLKDLDRLIHDEFEWSKLQEENKRLQQLQEEVERLRGVITHPCIDFDIHALKGGNVKVLTRRRLVNLLESIKALSSKESKPS